jgi:hypothetical protein
MVKKDSKLLIIACEVLQDELKAVSAPGVQFDFLEQGLHRVPSKMPAAIQEKIDQADSQFDYVLLGYGSCGSGILGVKAGKQPLVIPRAHDCISFYLGSIKNHQQTHEKNPGTYYLTKGWIEQAKSPLGTLEEYTERYGRETAEWVIGEEFKNYNRLVLVHTGVYDPAAYREQAKANAAFLGVAYEEIKGTLAFFKKMVNRRWSEEDFIILQPGEEITQSRFLSIIGCQVAAAG